MKNFISHAEEIHEILTHIVQSPILHAKWINTLSYLENSGARKIAACEHPRLVKEEMLKHASEEFRHAHYLKRQIERIYPASLDTYSEQDLLGGMNTIHYLQALDIKTSRFLLQTAGLPKHSLREVSYLAVTYAIELRAEELYPIYDKILRKESSKVSVKSILLEEKEHLREVVSSLEKTPSGLSYAYMASTFENNLCRNWLQAISEDVKRAPDIVT